MARSQPRCPAPQRTRRLLDGLKLPARALLRLVFRVRVRGLEHVHAAGDRVLVVANHTSYLDAVLLALFLPGRLTFAIDPRVAGKWWVRPFLAFADVLHVDPAQPIAARRLVRELERGCRAAIFPEGRITVTGSLMKVYPGPAFVADRSGAAVLPVRIAGAERSHFSLLGGVVRRRGFPRITLTVLPARRITLPHGLRGAARRRAAARLLGDLMADLVFRTADWRRTVPEALLEARGLHGGRHVAVEDTDRAPLSYDALLARAEILGKLLAGETELGERVGVLLPGSVGCLVTFLALQLRGRVPAMLNFTSGAAGMAAACRLARVRTVYTSRRFVETARLGDEVGRLGEHVRVAWLEDLRGRVTLGWRLAGLLRARRMAWSGRPRWRGRPDDPAVVLFTSGSEGTPKGVVLSHANLLANVAQILSRVDATPRDVLLNTLPLFHAFGLTVGALLPVLAGVRVFLYPSPLHYRVVPEMAYEVGATLMFGTSTFLAGYARHAHPYDFFRVRYVFAGAEPLDAGTRQAWSDRFGVRILEGYGTTETAPVLAANDPMDSRPGTVGRFLPGVEWALDPVPGLERGGRLSVRGPTVMLGYLRADRPGEIEPPATGRGPGWYDTGDLVAVDDDGFVTIQGRARRFAKVAGEMVSLATVERVAARAWPDAGHAALTLGGGAGRERVVLITERRQARRQDLVRQARAEGVSSLHVPDTVLPVPEIPRFAVGKTDYPAARRLAEARLREEEAG